MPKPSFSVRIERDSKDGIYYVRCLDLQGCHSFGKTRAEALEKIREAIAGHLAVSLHAESPLSLSTQGPEVVELVA